MWAVQMSTHSELGIQKDFQTTLQVVVFRVATHTKDHTSIIAFDVLQLQIVISMPRGFISVYKN